MEHPIYPEKRRFEILYSILQFLLIEPIICDVEIFSPGESEEKTHEMS